MKRNLSIIAALLLCFIAGMLTPAHVTVNRFYTQRVEVTPPEKPKNALLDALPDLNGLTP